MTLIISFIQCSTKGNIPFFKKDEIKEIGTKIVGMVSTVRTRPGIWGTRGQAYGNYWDYDGHLLPLYYNIKWNNNDMSSQDLEFILDLSVREDQYLTMLAKEGNDTSKFELTDFQNRYHYNHFVYSNSYHRFYILENLNKISQLEQIVESLYKYNSHIELNRTLYSDARMIQMLTRTYIITKDTTLLPKIDGLFERAKHKILDPLHNEYETHEPNNILFTNTRIAHACAIICEAYDLVTNHIAFREIDLFRQFIYKYLQETKPEDVASSIKDRCSYSGIDYTAPVELVTFIINNLTDNQLKSYILNNILLLLWKYQYPDGTWWYFRCTLTTVKSLDMINTIITNGNKYLSKPALSAGIETKNRALKWLSENYIKSLNSYPILTTLGGMEDELTPYELLCLLRIYNITGDQSLLKSIRMACYKYVIDFSKHEANASSEASGNEIYRSRIPINVGEQWAFSYSEIFYLAYKVFKEAGEDEQYLYLSCLEAMYEKSSISILSLQKSKGILGWFKNISPDSITSEEDLEALINMIRIIANIQPVCQMDVNLRCLKAAKIVLDSLETKVNRYVNEGQMIVINYPLIKNDPVPYDYRYKVLTKVLTSLNGVYHLNIRTGINDKQIHLSVISILQVLLNILQQMDTELKVNHPDEITYMRAIPSRMYAYSEFYKIAKHYEEFNQITKPLGQKFKQEIMAKRAYKHPVYHGRELVYGLGGPMLYAILAE
jgi:hypothetical protein